MKKTATFQKFDYAPHLIRNEDLRLYWCTFPEWLFNVPISDGAKICFSKLLRRGEKYNYAPVTVNTLANDLNKSERQIQRHLLELEEFNLIRIEQREGKISYYYFYGDHEYFPESLRIPKITIYNLFDLDLEKVWKMESLNESLLFIKYPGGTVGRIKQDAIWYVYYKINKDIILKTKLDSNYYLPIINLLNKDDYDTDENLKYIRKIITFIDFCYLTIICSKKDKKIAQWQQRNKRKNHSILLIYDKTLKKWQICGKKQGDEFISTQEISSNSKLYNLLNQLQFDKNRTEIFQLSLLCLKRIFIDFSTPETNSDRKIGNLDCEIDELSTTPDISVGSKKLSTTPDISVGRGVTDMSGGGDISVRGGVTYVSPPYNRDNIIDILNKKIIGGHENFFIDICKKGGLDPPLENDYITQFMESYPKQCHPVNMKRLINLWIARRIDGNSADKIISGLKEYAEYCKEQNYTGTTSVMNPVKFLDQSEFEVSWLKEIHRPRRS